MAHLSTPEAVIELTRIDHTKMGKKTDDELNELLTRWLTEITGLVCKRQNRDFITEAGGDPADVDPGLHHIVAQMAGNAVGTARQRAQNNVVKIDDFNVRVVGAELFTAPIRDALKAYPPRARVGMARVRGTIEREADDASA